MPLYAIPSYNDVVCNSSQNIPCASASSHLCWPVCRRFNRLVLLLSNEHCLPSLPLSYCHPCPKFAPPIYVHLLRRAASTSIHRPSILDPSIHPVHSHHVESPSPPSTSPLSSPLYLTSFSVISLRTRQLSPQSSRHPLPPPVSPAGPVLVEPFLPVASSPNPPCLAVLLGSQHLPRFHLSALGIVQALQQSIKQPNLAATCRQ